MVENVRTLLGKIVLLELALSANVACPDIFVEVYLNGTKLFESAAQKQVQTITYNIDESPADHALQLVMRGKNFSHTQFNDAEEIVKDIYFQVDRLEFENIDMREIFCLGKSCYAHNFNSTDPVFLDEFYGIIGCNGTVSIEFSTPIYLWFNNHF
jgi:hypothetical protein